MLQHILATFWPPEAVPAFIAQKYSDTYVIKHTVKMPRHTVGLTWTLEVDV